MDHWVGTSWHTIRTRHHVYFSMSYTIFGPDTTIPFLSRPHSLIHGPKTWFQAQTVVASVLARLDGIRCGAGWIGPPWNSCFDLDLMMVGFGYLALFERIKLLHQSEIYSRLFNSLEGYWI